MTADRGRGILEEVGPDGTGVTRHEIGKGRFIDGHDNLAFGRWNRVVAWLPHRREARVLPGHGGEIIPGTFAGHVERLRADVTAGVPRPIQLDLDVSMACPSSCSFCFSAPYRAQRTSGRLMATSAIERTIDDLAALGVEVVRFDGGGDPLTHPRLLDAIRQSDRLGLTTAVLTAGDLLHERQFETFVEARTYVRVSLNAATDTTRLTIHSPRSRRLSHHRVVQHLTALDRLRRREHGADPRTSMLLGATSMVHPLNVAETYDIAASARDAGLDHLSFRVVLGRHHALQFDDAQKATFAAHEERVRADLVDDTFQVFFPTRPLTDTGYVPASYFTHCRASTHRALVEVGPTPDQPAIVPCGRYRGQGFLAAHTRTPTLFALLGPTTAASSVWLDDGMQATLRRFPSACGDCIDRSANLFLEGITEALEDDITATFFRFALDDPAPHS